LFIYVKWAVWIIRVAGQAIIIFNYRFVDEMFDSVVSILWELFPEADSDIIVFGAVGEAFFYFSVLDVKVLL
jgi:hypothetical protein